MSEVINTIMTWVGWQEPTTVALLFENIFRVSITLGLVLFIFKGVFRLADVHRMI